MAQSTLSERVAAEVRAELARQRRNMQGLIEQIYGVSPATMRRKITGLYPLDLDELERVAEVLGVPAEELITRAQQAEREAV